MSQLLPRVGIHYNRGRDQVHSPDACSQTKVEAIQALKERVQQIQGQEILLSLDERTSYRQPSLARGYEEAGEARPHAERSLASNTATRVVGTLDALSGRVLFQSGSKVGIKHLVHLYQHVRHTYQEAHRIWIVLDNWPVHFPGRCPGCLGAPGNALCVLASPPLAPDTQSRSSETLGGTALTDPVRAEADLCVLVQPH
jgi:hypothetical protein